MKALTIHQPYAQLIAVGTKRYETRSWSTKYRGPVLIHAGREKALVRDYTYDFVQWWNIAESEGDWLCLPKFNFAYQVATKLAEAHPYQDCWRASQVNYVHGVRRFFFGGFIALGELVECHPVETLDLTAQERLFGNYAPGRFAWEFKDVRLLETPIPFKGQQGLWNVALMEPLSFYKSGKYENITFETAQS